jgi:serine protease inhibitor
MNCGLAMNENNFWAIDKTLEMITWVVDKNRLSFWNSARLELLQKLYFTSHWGENFKNDIFCLCTFFMAIHHIVTV